MASRYAGAIVGQLDRIFNRGTVTGLNEGQLLHQFVTARDEAAFTALVARHGPMVLGVCRRILRDEHEVEDAFQATFLVLVRRAGAIRDRDLLGHWLYGVAHRVAVRARANAARRHVHEQTKPAADRTELGVLSWADADQRELRAILDEELARLPESLRAPLVFCYLDGLTHEEAAHRLRWPVGTVRSRMARGRRLLRDRLARRGLVAAGAALPNALAPEPVPAALLETTVRASLTFSARQAAAASLATASASASALAQGVIHAMTLFKLKVLGASALACLLGLYGARTFALQYGGAGGGGEGPAPKAEAKADAQRDSVNSLLDRIKTTLAESDRQNAELRAEVESLRKELDALRSGQAGNQPPAPNRKGVDRRSVNRGAAGGAGAVGPGGMMDSMMMGRPGGAGAGGMMPGGMGGGSGRPGGMGSGGAMMMPGGMGGGGGRPGGMGGGGGGGGTSGGMDSAMQGMMGQMGGGMGPGGRGGRAMMMGGMGGMSMMGGSMMGGPPDPNRLQYIQQNQLVVVASPEGDKVTAFSTETGKTTSLRLFESKEPSRQVSPIVNPKLVALAIEGPKIDRIAVFNVDDGTWYAQDLRKPVEQATPIISNQIAAYVLGNRVYAFSPQSKRWAVLDLPEGANPQPRLGNDSVLCEHDGHLYVFSANLGKWLDLDARKLLNSPGVQDEPPAEEPAEPQGTPGPRRRNRRRAPGLPPNAAPAEKPAAADPFEAPEDAPTKS